MKTHSSLIAVTTFALLSISSIQEIQAADIRVLSTPTLKPVIDELRPNFEQSSGHKLTVVFDGVGPLKKRIDSGEQFDVAILLPNLLDDLSKTAKVIGASQVNLARSAVGVAYHAGSVKPAVGTADALRQSLLAAKAMSYSPDSASGAYFVSLFERLGIPEAKARLKAVAGAAVIDAVAKGDVDLTVITVPNIIGVPGVELAGLLPEELQNYTVFSAGISATAKSPDASQTLISYLMSAESTPSFLRHGMTRVGP